MFNLPIMLAAEATSFDLASLLQAGVDSVKGDLFSALGIVVPAVLGVTGAVVGVRFGLKWLKSLGKG